MTRIDDVIKAHKTGTTIAQDAWLDRLARLAAEARRPPSVLDDPTLMQPGAAVKAKNGYRTSEQGFNYGEYA